MTANKSIKVIGPTGNVSSITLTFPPKVGDIIDVYDHEVWIGRVISVTHRVRSGTVEVIVMTEAYSIV